MDRKTTRGFSGELKYVLTYHFNPAQQLLQILTIHNDSNMYPSYVSFTWWLRIPCTCVTIRYEEYGFG